MAASIPRCWFCGASSAVSRRLRYCYSSDSLIENVTHTEACEEHVDAAESLGTIYHTLRRKRESAALLKRALVEGAGLEQLTKLQTELDDWCATFELRLREGYQDP